MSPIARSLAITIASLGVFACKDVSPPSSLDVPQTQVVLANDADAQRIASNAYQHTATLLSFGHRQPQSVGLRKSKDYVIAELKKHGWECVEQKFTAHTPKGEIAYSNLIARHKPNNSKSPWSRTVSGVVAAHIDSKIQPDFLGADDAASAVATILALAEHLHQSHPATANSLELVFFDGEEAIGNMNTIDGLYGSKHYSRAVQANAAGGIHPYRKAPKFGIVLDMIGHSDLSIRIPSDTPAQMRNSYVKARKKLGLEKHFGFALMPILDDHLPMNEIAQIPTIDLIGDFYANKWWHTSKDNLDIISEDSLRMSIQMTLEIISNQL